MRLIVKKYSDGNSFIVETTSDGSKVIKELEGTREIGERIAAYLEATCDDNESGVARLIEALTWLREEAEKRKADFRRKAKRKSDRTHTRSLQRRKTA
jgi:hypothetical protein